MKTIKPIEASGQYRSLLSLEANEYSLLYSIFAKKVEKKLRRYTLKGNLRSVAIYKERLNSSLQGSRLKLDFILVYLKSNPTQCLMAYLYGMSQSKVSEWISFLLPVLEASLQALKVCAEYGDTYIHKDSTSPYLLGDVVEKEVPRKSCYKAQKEEYSGKKKRHTNKHFALCDHRSYIFFLSFGYLGKIHDKSIWDQLDIHTQGKHLFLDLGFLGAQKKHKEILLPFKKPKKKL